MSLEQIELRYPPNPKTLTIRAILRDWLKDSNNYDKVPTLAVTKAEHDILQKTADCLLSLEALIGEAPTYLIAGTDEEIWRLKISENQLEYPKSEPGPREHVKL